MCVREEKWVGERGRGGDDGRDGEWVGDGTIERDDNSEPDEHSGNEGIILVSHLSINENKERKESAIRKMKGKGSNEEREKVRRAKGCRCVRSDT